MKKLATIIPLVALVAAGCGFKASNQAAQTRPINSSSSLAATSTMPTAPQITAKEFVNTSWVPDSEADEVLTFLATKKNDPKPLLSG